MSTEDKGKGRAVEPIVLDDDSDSDTEFFTVKKRTYTKPLSPIPNVDVNLNTSNGGSDGYTTDEDGEVKRRRKRPTKKPQKILPDWTRKPTSDRSRTRSMGRGSTEDRRLRDNGEVVHVSSGDEGRNGQGKGKEKERSKRVELTPPPPLSKQKRQELRRLVEQSTTAPPFTIDYNEAPSSLTENFNRSSSPIPVENANQDKMTVCVRMVADPLRLNAETSQTATKAYERATLITIFRGKPLSILWNVLAERMKTDPEDIVLEYNDSRIYSKRATAKQLRMEDGALLKGYDKAFWDRRQKEKRQGLQQLVEGTPPETPDETRSPSPPPAPVADQPAQPNKTRVLLRGTWGEFKLGVAHHVLVSTLAQFYCRKAGKDVALSSQLRLMFDGDTLSADATLGELEVEHGDMIDVEGCT